MGENSSFGWFESAAVRAFGSGHHELSVSGLAEDHLDDAMYRSDRCSDVNFLSAHS